MVTMGVAMVTILLYYNLFILFYLFIVFNSFASLMFYYGAGGGGDPRWGRPDRGHGRSCVCIRVCIIYRYILYTFYI